LDKARREETAALEVVVEASVPEEVPEPETVAVLAVAVLAVTEPVKELALVLPVVVAVDSVLVVVDPVFVLVPVAVPEVKLDSVLEVVAPIANTPLEEIISDVLKMLTARRT